MGGHNPNAGTYPSATVEPVRESSPKRLDEFIGQEPIIEAIKTLVDVAKRQGNPFPHFLLCGQGDMGKATLVGTLPRALGVEFQSTSAKRLRSEKDLVPYLTNAAEGSVLLIEDVEALKNSPLEMLVETIAHCRIDFVIGEGISTRTINMPLKHFTIAMTTTKASQVDNRLCRHAFVYHLAPYSLPEIARIIDRLANQLELRIDPGALDLLAAHCKGSPGNASTMAMRLQTYFGSVNGGFITVDIAKKALSVFGLAHDDVLVTGHPADVLRMSGPEFEQFVADLFRRLGYAVEITGTSGDHGIDLLMRKDNKLVVAQCKRWENPVGEPVVRDFYGSLVSKGAQLGYVITTSSFTAQAATFAENKPIRLIDLARLNQLVVQSNSAVPGVPG